MPKPTKKNQLRTRPDETAKAGVVRVDFFKPSGKWYTTEAVDMLDFRLESMVEDAAAKALFKHLKKPYQKGRPCELRLSGITAVILHPCHEQDYPLMLPVDSCTPTGYQPRLQLEE